MKKLSIVIIAAFLIAIIGGIVGASWWFNVSKAPGTSTEEVRVVIPKGSSIEAIGKELGSAGVLKSPLAFKAYIAARGITNTIPAGEFEIPRNLNLFNLIALLQKGPKELWVTIPEGLRREEVVEKFITGLELKGDEEKVFRQEFLQATTGLEGHLFPDTYLFPREVTAQKVVDRMTNLFDQKFSRGTSPLTDKEIVILASLIERETLSKEERPIVAGILMNRLNADWPLQVDASVQYVLGEVGDWWPKNITRANLEETTSPYNTYKYLGLPPAPIANPGETSLNAAANPVATEYWYYIHDADGVIHYAETLDEHNANVRKYLGK